MKLNFIDVRAIGPEIYSVGFFTLTLLIDVFCVCVYVYWYLYTIYVGFWRTVIYSKGSYTQSNPTESVRLTMSSIVCMALNEITVQLFQNNIARIIKLNQEISYYPSRIILWCTLTYTDIFQYGLTNLDSNSLFHN